MNNKSEIKKNLILLRRRGCFVFNLNNKRPNNAGTAGLTDWIIITKSNVVFAEVKIGKDELSETQNDIKARLEKIMLIPNSRIYYYIIKNGKDTERLQGKILLGEL